MAYWFGILLFVMAIGAGITFRFILARPWNGPLEKNLYLRKAIFWGVICIALASAAKLILIPYLTSVYGSVVN